MQPTTSFWDCGEYIACSKILGVMHPPGNPLLLLFGRIMTMIPTFKDIGMRLNVFSVLTSALTVMFTFLIIVKLIKRWRGEAKTEDRLILYASGCSCLNSPSLTASGSMWILKYWFRCCSRRP
jgi:hypothetical protein